MFISKKLKFKKSGLQLFFFLLLGNTVLIAEGNEKRNSVSNILFISPVEVKAGREVATTHCAKCHDMSGQNEEKNTPNLASQHVDYLYSQLRKFQTGERVFENGKHSLIALNDEALKNVSIYYFMQDLFAKAQMLNQSSKKTKNLDSPLAAGKKAALACESCHGKTGNGTFSGIPRLTGKHQTYLVSAIKAYKTGNRQDAMMSAATTSLNSKDIENLALFYASQKPQMSEIQGNGNANTGREESGSCAGCHGEIGHSPKAEVPSLAGQDPAYFIKAVNAYKNGSRNHNVMRSAVEVLTENKIANIATYFATQAPKAPTIIQPLTTAQLAEKCDRCHGVNGNSMDRFIPSISAQNQRYLISTLKDYKNGARKNPMMVAMLEPLRDVDIDALAEYYAKKNRRAMVFVGEKCD